MDDCISLSITHTGTFVFSTSHSFILKNVLVVPNIINNLLTISQFSFKNNCVFLFHPTYFLAACLSFFDAALIPASSMSCHPIQQLLHLLFSSHINPLTIRHYLLAHASSDIVIRLLNSIKTSFSCSPSSICMTCALSYPV